MRAKQETCPHPWKQRSTPAYGHLQCNRCGVDLTDPARHFEWRHSERVRFTQGDLVAVSGGPHGPAFHGVFQWAESFESGLAYCITELQRYMVEKTTYQGSAATRFIRPEYVRQEPGVRDRKRREEVSA